MRRDRFPSESALTVGALALLYTLALARPARAAGGGGDEEETLTVLLFLGAIGLAYFTAQFVVDALQRRFLVITGIEFVVTGVLLGPFVAGVLTDLGSVFPIIALTAGWVGLLRGMEFEFAGFLARPAGTMRIVILHHLIPSLLVGLTAWQVFFDDGLLAWMGWPPELYGGPSRETAASVFFLACAAAADSAAPFDILRRRYVIEGPLSTQLRAATRIGDVTVIMAFGLIFAIWHEPNVAGTRALVPAEWFLVELALGIGLGVLFTPFLVGNETANGRFLAMVGIITFASGAAYFVKLSPLAVNVVLGVTLMNLARTGRRTGRQMYETLRSTERPMVIVLALMAGALLRPPPLLPTLGVFVAYVVLRGLGKALASRLGAFGQKDTRTDLYLGLLHQGDVTVAMAVSFQLVFEGPIVDLVYTVVLGGSLLSDLVAPRTLRRLLVNAGEVRRERRAEATTAEVLPA